MLTRTLFSFFCLLSINTYSQNDDNRSWSVFSGGMLLKQSTLWTTKAGWEKNKWSLLSDLTYDNYHETWDDGSSSKFNLYSVSLSGRYYLKPLGRSLFTEVTTGIAQTTLKTDENHQQKKRSASLPLAGFGIGWRFGKKPAGLFGEVGFRTAYSLKTLHLFTTDIQPDQNGLEGISYQSWYFERFRSSSQLYVGVGYSF